jgi:hypothetical protein
METKAQELTPKEKLAADEAAKARTALIEQEKNEIALEEKRKAHDAEVAKARAAYDAQPRVMMQRAVETLRSHRGDVADRLAALEAFVHHIAGHLTGLLPEAKPLAEVKPLAEDAPVEKEDEEHGKQRKKW